MKMMKMMKKIVYFQSGLALLAGVGTTIFAAGFYTPFSMFFGSDGATMDPTPLGAGVRAAVHVGFWPYFLVRHICCSGNVAKQEAKEKEEEISKNE